MFPPKRLLSKRGLKALPSGPKFFACTWVWSTALRLRFWKYSYAVPWKLLVPLFRVVLNCPPEEWPNSGLYWFCRTVKLCTASLGMLTNGPVTTLLLLSTPSISKLLLRERWPPMDGPVPAPTPPGLATPALRRDRFRTPFTPKLETGISIAA